VSAPAPTRPTRPAPPTARRRDRATSRRDRAGRSRFRRPRRRRPRRRTPGSRRAGDRRSRSAPWGRASPGSLGQARHPTKRAPSSCSVRSGSRSLRPRQRVARPRCGRWSRRSNPRMRRRGGRTRSKARRGPARRFRPGRSLRSNASRTRSMPSRAGGAARASSTVHTFSLPIATPCSFTPCSSPQSHAGREASSAWAPGSASSRYCVRTVPPAGRRSTRSTTCASFGGRSEFFPKRVAFGPTMQRVSHTSNAALTAARPRGAGP
jgi:hypothetical protein